MTSTVGQRPAPPGDDAPLSPGPRASERVDVDLVRRIALVSARINAGSALVDTLQSVADGVVEALGFGVAVVNFRRPDGDFEVLAITGPPDVHAALAHQVTPADVMDRILGRSISWGTLRFTPQDTEHPGEPAAWVPDVEVPDHPDAWYPDDLLLAPLSSAAGATVGILSVDLPPGQLRPSPLLREMLEIFAVQAGIAIDNARLAAALLAERAELRREQARLRASEVAFRFSFTGSGSAMAMVSLQPSDIGRVLRVNEAMSRMLGQPTAVLHGRSSAAMFGAADEAQSRDVLARFATGELTDLRVERRIERPDGVEQWLELTETAVHPGSGQPSFLLLHAQDVTERKFREGRLAHQAAHDALTGLPNRRLLSDRLQAAIAHARRTGRSGVVLFCDIDGFKELNDSFGHAAGDGVLAEVAARLLSGVRSRDTVGRLGGDEFVVIAEDLDDEAVEQFIARLRAVTAAPLTGIPGQLGLSIGAARITGRDPSASPGHGGGGTGGPQTTDSSRAAELLRCADAAMYADKLTRSGPAGRPA